MKKITYSLQFAFVGNNDIVNRVILTYLRKNAIDFSEESTKGEYLILYEDIPIRVKSYLKPDISSLIYEYDAIGNLDIIIFLADLSYPLETYNVKRVEIDELLEYYSFKGTTVLVGYINEFPISEQFKEKIAQKAKELELMYGFILSHDENEIRNFISAIFDDFVLKFEYSSPELFQKSKEYGKTLK